ncbi:MAG: D-2-hydroxyacid dehydrogenase [Candidatus Neomarinimicrobiota bacterium]
MATPARDVPLQILLVTRVSGLEAELRGRALPGVAWVRTKSDGDTAVAVPEAEVIVADPPLVAGHLERASALKWMQSTYAGVDDLVGAGARQDYLLTRLAEVFAPLMAEYVVAQMLARERYLADLARQQAARQWQPARYRSLANLTVGILGLGNIGQVVAAAAKAFGMTVWGLRRCAGAVPGVNRVFTTPELAAFLHGPDYLVNILPTTPGTRGLLSGDALKVCLPGTVLINIGRGDVIDEASLVRAVTEGWLGGAVLDVFEEEPLRSSSPLWDLPGVTITPHVAALGGAADIAEVVAANVERYLDGEPLNYVVDWERGY